MAHARRDYLVKQSWEGKNLKKNKKIVALLTLLVFAMTMILPMSAMAAGTAADVTVASSEINATVNVTGATASATYKATLPAGVTSAADITADAAGAGTAAVVLAAANTTDVAKDYVITYANVAAAADTFTVKVTQKADQAAVNGNVSASASVLDVNTFDAQVNEDVKMYVSLRDAADKAVTNANNPVYIWAEETPGQVSDALVGGIVTKTVGEQTVTFQRAGTYKLYASLTKPSVSDTSKDAAGDAVTVFKNADGNTVNITAKTVTVTDIVKLNGSTIINSNGIETTELTFQVKDANGPVTAGMTVDFTTNSGAITLDKTSATTNYNGEVKVKVTGKIDGEYKLYVKAKDVEKEFDITVEAQLASDIAKVNQPSAPLALNETIKNDTLTFKVMDANGSVIKNLPVAGAEYMFTKSPTADKNDYIEFKAPANSGLKESDVSLVQVDANTGEYGIKFAKAPEAEGTYTVVVALDNGKKVTFSFEVKEFGTAKELVIDYGTTTVELGATLPEPEIYFLDENGVKKTATNVDLGANGYALADFNTTGALAVKDDEKYLGSLINVYGVAEREGLTAKVKLTVTSGEGALAFVEKSGPVDTNNVVNFNVVDKDGNKLVIGDASNKAIKSMTAIVIDQSNPDAKISANVAGYSKNDILNKGEGILNVTSDKPGTAKVLVTIMVEELGNYGNTVRNQVYAGTLEYTFGGNAANSDLVVVMTIASKDTIVNDNIVTIDAAPFVNADWRTMVPFRALAEDFGATVEWDDAAKTVTAELDGVKVVMTIGSTTYTVNGVEKTMDTAPVIVDGRTFVPVRFAAEAFGFTVTPTYDAATGTTESVLFTR